MARAWKGSEKAVAEAFGGSSPEGSKRFWQGRRARGRKQALARESGGEDPRFGKATFPLAPPRLRGYAKGGGGVAGVTHEKWIAAGHDPGAFLELDLTNVEREWLERHDMPFPTENRVVVLRRIQQWDAEVAARLSSELKKGFVTTGEPSSLPIQQSLTSAASWTSSLWSRKKGARTRPKK